MSNMTPSEREQQRQKALGELEAATGQSESAVERALRRYGWTDVEDLRIARELLGRSNPEPRAIRAAFERFHERRDDRAAIFVTGVATEAALANDPRARRASSAVL